MCSSVGGKHLVGPSAAPEQQVVSGSQHSSGEATRGPCMVTFIPDMQHVQYRDEKWQIQHTVKETRWFKKREIKVWIEQIANSPDLMASRSVDPDLYVHTLLMYNKTVQLYSMC